jgi:formylglycine-generating enzyme required for sulfatase activity
MTGQVWQWTRSSYDPIPASSRGTAHRRIQRQVHGGADRAARRSCATPRGHARPSYRNFFPPAARWQFTGLRLAKDDAC